MTPEQAGAVFDVLVRHAGAAEHQRDEFVYHLRHGCEEFRFMGSLGFGGKLYVEPGRWRVGCYPEDLTPERAAVIERVNAVLDGARAVFAALEAA
ncbi:hypothetical protein ACFFX1_55460 [Dactylosporangium sucinum]|uniref:Uncharacterized protein n=1 Tax=Dactylosporangium sucinum TaxID=1424081 RepID=A0A917X051_9ACTN|nr:hypothetical protein [Dactylosporangium sucinum]GGM52605.1 hypothetical protein GCM10007977_062720 [Dactylosporangium sucinum]